jgi:hypothetical protein
MLIISRQIVLNRRSISACLPTPDAVPGWSDITLKLAKRIMKIAGGATEHRPQGFDIGKHTWPIEKFSGSPACSST